nr:GntR family transcriptional regulator [Rhodococcus sp. (in: high G+C Gram-positive bacteria)]
MTMPAVLVAAERAYTTTKAKIISGELVGGQLISEGAIGDQLGISRTPVHEAFLRLGAEQLLDLVPRKGAVVRPMTPSEAADVLAMRRAIETASAGQVFAAGGVAARIETLLNENLARQGDLVADDDVEGFVEADDDFHALMIEASGNAVARQFYNHLRSRQQRLRNLYLRIDPANLKGSFREHTTLSQHLLGGDENAFVAVLVAHLDRYQGAL